MLVGKRIDSGEELQHLLSPVKGNHFAKAALDLAWWDLEARMDSVPLWKLLGGRRQVVEVGADFGVKESIGELLRAIDGALQSGYKRVKLKFRPGWDLPMIRAVRKAFAQAVFHVDCNSAYRLEDLDMLRSLDEFELAMIEQPLAHDDLLDHAELQRQIHTPICLDESITSAAKARQAAQIRACGWINIKPGRVGGLTVAVQIHDLCLEAGIPCWVGGMLESSLGAHQCLSLATLPNFVYPNDIFPSSTYYRIDLCDPPVVLSGASQMTAPDTAGSGAEPNPARLKAQTLERVIVRC
jgi:O-succinylbenzoate synthase